MGEEAVVGKQVRATEEVRLHKDTVAAQQQVSETARKERVTVEGSDFNKVVTDDSTLTR